MAGWRFHFVVVLLCFIQRSVGDVEETESRKLFGGYKITPKFCKPTRPIDDPQTGPNICMFQHECTARHGTVAGACMDGFLFGACCHLPAGSAGELVESDGHHPTIANNNIESHTKTTSQPNNHWLTDSVSKITMNHLHNSAISTVDDDEIFQFSGKPEFSSTPGLIQSASSETVLLNNENNEIDPFEFHYPGLFNPKITQAAQHSSTPRVETSTSPYVSNSVPLVQISLSHVPHITTSQGFQKPMFRPRPTSIKPGQEDKYILIPTITHPPKPNKTQELESIVNIIQMLNETSTPNPFLSSARPTIYLQQTTKSASFNDYTTSKASWVTTRRPSITTTRKQTTPIRTTSRKPPSTSYVYSTTIPPRRTTQGSSKPSTYNTQTTKLTKKPTYVYASSSRPGQVTPVTKPTTNKYVYPSSTFKPNSSTKRPRPMSSTKRPSTISASVSGPSFTVTNPTKDTYSSTYPSPAPTLIVLTAVNTEDPTDYQSSTPPPRPVTQLTINNYVTANNNYHLGTTERPPPTVLITPKPPPNIITAGSHRPIAGTTEYTTAAELEIETSAYDLINFPPVRNPNLNTSASISSSEEDIDFTTPTFVEDQSLNKKVESFVNKIVQSLQNPFNELKDVVYEKNKTSSSTSTTKKPTTKKPVTTKKPTRISSSKPTSSRPTSRPSASRPTSRRPTTKRPTGTTRRTTAASSTTPKRTRPTKRVTTTPEPAEAIEEDVEEIDTEEELDYRKHCGIRPLVKSGRIVGGKGATFGEFPWQVLVRESTWLGLFTKNKCGGVLISNQYVVTAAHCQPGFLASLVAVFGEFDISANLESRQPISKNVRRVIVHRQYDAATFENDLALLELESPVQYDQHIVPICLPRADEDFTGRMATVTGWGRLKYGGGVPSLLQEVQVPIMENHVCQEMFRTAGHSKVILDSFLCAGYANGQKDSCEGDSGGPLVLQRPDGRWQLAGTVSHGIKCAAPYLPGVYMRTTYYKPWLESVTGVH